MTKQPPPSQDHEVPERSSAPPVRESHADQERRARELRLAEQLRANLRKRKAQARGRKAGEPD